MYKLYTFLIAVFISSALIAQVNVTYQVDITDYLLTTPLGENGIRIGGNFADLGATKGGEPMLNWSPADANSALTDMGDNIWSITVTYPDTSIAKLQQYKFVNNDWGTNEGTDPANTIATDGCGTDDGSGNINRELIIPANDVTNTYCWDRCLQCDGSDPSTDIENVDAIKYAVSISPNPFNSNVEIAFNLVSNEKVTLTIYNMMGAQVATLINGNLGAGNHVANWNGNNLPAGNYMYRLQAGAEATSGSIVKL